MSNRSQLYKIILFSGSFLFCLVAAHAQYGDAGYYNQANKLFKGKNYYEAVQCYEKYLASEKKSKPRGMPFAVEKKVKGKTNLNPHQESVYNLAESYRMCHDYVQAEKWYKEATTFSTKAYPACEYWYAVSLRANQKYAEAIEAITSFLNKYTTLDDLLMSADRELDNLKYIQAQLARKNKDRFILAAKNNNDNASSYAMSVQHGDTVVFTSIHVNHSTTKNAADTYTNDLYMATDSDIAQSSMIKLPAADDIQNGLTSFTQDGKTMFFTRWTKKDGKTNSSIYSCYKTDEGWSQPVKLSSPINVDGYNSTQPFITENNYLLFSSDRPGGVGNYDLWYAVVDSSFQPITVANLGDVINTAGDDESPYYHQLSGTLVFSSNGRTGMGGFDIYYAKNESNFTHWGQPQNPGFPINSTKDDLYYISTDKDNLWNTGWLSSDRSTACCLALFAVREDNKQFVTGSVKDCNTGMPLANVQLNVTDPKHDGKLIGRYNTDSLGRYKFELHNASRFQVLAQKQDYVARENGYAVHFENLVDTINNDEVCLVPVHPDKSVKDMLKSLSRSRTVGNFGYKKASLPRSGFGNLDSLVNLMKNNPAIKIQVEGYTDGIGGEAYNKRLAQSRVDFCIRYLVKKGISAKRLRGKSFGKCCPIEPETINGKDNPAGREINRRVEYKLITE